MVGVANYNGRGACFGPRAGRTLGCALCVVGLVSMCGAEANECFGTCMLSARGRTGKVRHIPLFADERGSGQVRDNASGA